MREPEYETSDARLDRLNWQSRRRQWDSALAPPATAALQDSQGTSEIPMPMLLLKERFSELEHRVDSLTRELGRFHLEQRRGKRRRWVVILLALTVVGTFWALGSVGIGLAFLNGPAITASVGQ